MWDQLVRRDSAGGWSCPDWSRWELVSTGQQWMLEQTLASLLEILLEMVMIRVSINTEELVVISILSRWWLSLSTHVDTRHCLRSVISGQEMARPDTRTVPRLWDSLISCDLTLAGQTLLLVTVISRVFVVNHILIMKEYCFSSCLFLSSMDAEN